MKILFVISSVNSPSHGLGGHYHSLIHIATELSKHHEIVVVNIGTEKAKAFENIDLKLYNIIYKNARIISIFSDLGKIIELEKPNVIHSFDRIAYFWGRMAARKFNLKSVLTKCGGANDVYTPYCENLILFSKENYDFFKKAPQFKNSKLFLIPNRVKPFNSNFDRISSLEERLNKKEDGFRFLRIARIGSFYKKSSLQLINLVNKLNKDGINCSAIFIGTVQEAQVLDDLILASNKNIYFFTDDIYTKNAKELIDVSNAVLGTGRSLMEASTKRKVLLTPSKDDTPILIDNESFEEAFSGNFSERVLFKSIDMKQNYIKIKEMIVTDDLQIKHQSFSTSIFNEYFNIDKVPSMLEKVYEIPSTQKIKYFDFIKHYILIIKTFIKK